MRKNHIGKLLIFNSVAIFSLIGCNGNSAPEGTKTVNVYKSDSGIASLIGTTELRFFKEQNGVPYVAIDKYLQDFIPDVFSIKTASDKYIFTNTIWANDTRRTYSPNATFDINNNSLTYDDYTCFVCSDSTAYNPLDLNNGKYYEKTGLFKLIEDNYTAGSQITIDLDDYSIKTYYTDGRLYFPLYTAKCLFALQTTSYFYNGNALYIDAVQQDCSFNRTVRNNLFTPSSTYLEYAYNQFALDIDLHFGMRNFSRKLRSNNNTDYKFMGGNGGNAYSVLNKTKSNFLKSAKDFDDATMEFYKNYMDDGGHTGLLSRSYYNDVNASVTYGNELKYSSSISNNIDYSRELNGIDITKGYLRRYNDSETANYYNYYFTFDSFDSTALNYGLIPLVRNYNNDCKHLVIDLSNNGGGLVIVAEMLINFLTKGRASNHVMSSVNQSKGYTKYNSDNNYDRVIDSSDYLSNDVESIDIITSGHSFSAANYTACQVAKYGDDSHTKVYIDGENSGGGVCAVESSMMNAIGMTSQWSSLYRLCEEKNDGEWVGVDDGVTSVEKSGTTTKVTINGESWNSLSKDINIVKKYSDYDSLNQIINDR